MGKGRPVDVSGAVHAFRHPLRSREPPPSTARPIQIARHHLLFAAVVVAVATARTASRVSWGMGQKTAWTRVARMQVGHTASGVACTSERNVTHELPKAPCQPRLSRMRAEHHDGSKTFPTLLSNVQPLPALSKAEIVPAQQAPLEPRSSPRDNLVTFRAGIVKNAGHVCNRFASWRRKCILLARSVSLSTIDVHGTAVGPGRE